MVLGIKWRFLDEDSAGVAVGVYPQVEMVTVASSVRGGLAESGPTLLLPLVVQKDLGIASANLELQYQARSGRENGWFAGLAVQPPDARSANGCAGGRCPESWQRGPRLRGR